MEQQEHFPLDDHDKLNRVPYRLTGDDAVNQIRKQCFNRISDALANWQVTDVRCVPGVMYQVRCGGDELDKSIEYQINWFLDCTETFLHNHRHSFDTFCLEGEYIETIWEVVDDGDGEITYQFRRNSDNKFHLHKTLPGALRPVRFRHHFPGNQMHVDTCQFHSISPITGAGFRVLTFLVKRNYLPVPDMFVLSPLSAVEAIKDEVRPATADERQAMYEKLQELLARNLHK